MSHDLMTESPSPQTTQERIHDALRSYFKGHQVTMLPDALWTKMLEGFLVDVATTGWTGWVKILPEDVGLSSAAYAVLDLRWGSINILDPSLRTKLATVRNAAITLPNKWGRKVRWGQYIPVTAMTRFRDSFEQIQAEWQPLIDEWVAQYDQYYQYAVEQVEQLALQAVTVATKLDEPLRAKHIAPTEIQDRILQSYPSIAMIRDFTLDYAVSLIPTPQLTAQHVAELELIEEEKKQRLATLRAEIETRQYEQEADRLKALNAVDLETRKQQQREALLREEHQRLQKELTSKSEQLLNEFYTGYALEIRQRLHEVLQYTIDGVRKGKLTPASTRSLRLVLDELKDLIADDDLEMIQMRERLHGILESDNSSRDLSERIAPMAEELGILLQTSIMALGEQPRMPRRNTKTEFLPQDILHELGDADLEERVRLARHRVGLDSSLAEDLVAGSSLTVEDLQRRSRRFEPVGYEA